MLTVWKFSVPADKDLFAVAMPAGARLLAVQVQTGVPCVWAAVDPKAQVVGRRFRWAGTGHPVLEADRYVGTIQLYGGALVFHLFDLGE